MASGDGGRDGRCAQTAWGVGVTAEWIFFVGLGVFAYETPKPNEWWLDVESAKSWELNTASNVSEPQGEVAYLQSKGATAIGVYANGSTLAVHHGRDGRVHEPPELAAPHGKPTQRELVLRDHRRHRRPHEVQPVCVRRLRRRRSMLLTPRTERTATMRLIRLVAVSTTLTLTAVGGSVAAQEAKPPPRLANPTAAAKPLVTRFFKLVEHKDVARLRAFLSPAFQVERADGSGKSKKQYLTHLSTVTKFSLEKLVATQAGPVLVVRYLATVEGLVNGKRYTPGPAPRLSTFVWNGARWQLAAHANFNPLTG